MYTRTNLRRRLTILQAARITVEYTATALITQRNIRSSVYTVYTVDNLVAYMNMQFPGAARHETVISFDTRSCVNPSLLRALTACRFTCRFCAFGTFILPQGHDPANVTPHATFARHCEI